MENIKRARVRGSENLSMIDSVPDTSALITATEETGCRRKVRSLGSLALGKTGGTIHGRVQGKTALRSFFDGKETKQIFNFTLIGATAKVTVVVVGIICENLFETLAEDGAYRIMNFKTIPVNKQYDRGF